MGDDRGRRFDELYKYYPAVVAQLLRMGFDREDARDLAQDVFVRVFNAMDAYRDEARLSYLMQVTRRLAYNAIRDGHAAKREGIPVPADELLGLTDDAELADKTIERAEDVQGLLEAIAQLPPEDQTALRLQLAGHKLEEIAPKLHLSVAALKSRLNVARSRLRELLGRSRNDP